MREICLVQLDKTRPAVVLTREGTRAAMTKITIAPITSTIKGLSSEVPMGPANGLDHEGVISLDNVVTVQTRLLGRTIGFLSYAQEAELARAVVLAYDLDIPLLDSSTYEPAPLPFGGLPTVTFPLLSNQDSGVRSVVGV